MSAKKTTTMTENENGMFEVDRESVVKALTRKESKAVEARSKAEARAAAADATENGAARRKGEILEEKLTVKEPNLQTIAISIVGTSPYVQNRFANKAAIIAAQMEGSTGKKGKKKDPKDFDALYRGALHISEEGWYGIPATAFRNACISACKIINFAMTRAKLCIFIVADGYDVSEGAPLVKILKGDPRPIVSPVRNDSGVIDMRPRPVWAPGWEATVRVKFDANIFKTIDVVNLLDRAGLQVGVGEGRNDSKDSNGCGWGSFEVRRGPDPE